MKGSLKGGGVDVAIKVLKNGMGEKEKLRFLQEGAVNGQFHHPNVVKLYGMVTIGEPVSINTSRSPRIALHIIVYVSFHKDCLAYYLLWAGACSFKMCNKK